MPYPEIMIRPMREELTRLGARELKTPAQVDETLQNSDGTVMVVVNSICGCAAGKARPAISIALQHETRPDQVVTVFAGADIEATERARDYFTGYPPSSPSIALLKEGKAAKSLFSCRLNLGDSSIRINQSSLKCGCRCLEVV